MSLNQKEPVYIIIPVHNRKNITLQCLETLKQCGDLERYYTVAIADLWIRLRKSASALRPSLALLGRTLQLTTIHLLQLSPTRKVIPLFKQCR